MSKLYEKSISEKYKRYFESTSSLTRGFHQYSLKKREIMSCEDENKRQWESGKVGVPLNWQKSQDVVSVDHTDSHTLVIGPTGSKKSRLVAMPLVYILGAERESIIVSDPKAEIFNRTADYLKRQGYQIYVLNLRMPRQGDGWNPLTIPYMFFCRGEIDKAYEFVNDIAENLIHSNKSQSDPFWDNSAGAFFFGLVALLFKFCKEHNVGEEYVHIGNVIRLRNEILSGPNGGKNSALWQYAKTDQIIASAMVGTVETANDTRAGILSVFDQKMRIFSIQPNLLELLSKSDIDFDVITQKPTAIFMVLPDEKTGYHGLASLFIKQNYEYIINKAQMESLKNNFQVGKLTRRVNYVLDEFSSLPTIHDFPAMITASRSRNIRFTLIIQSKHQLLQRYAEEAETIQTNCNNWIFLASRELKLLEEISELCGKTSEGKPVLSVAALQWLDKEEGEALVLSGRNKPCVTHLPDINEYDEGEYEIINVPSREPSEISMLDFRAFFEKNNSFMINSLGLNMTEEHINTIISAIDKKKIEELEKEEIRSETDDMN